MKNSPRTTVLMAREINLFMLDTGCLFCTTDIDAYHNFVINNADKINYAAKNFEIIKF